MVSREDLPEVCRGVPDYCEGNVDLTACVLRAE